MLSDLQEPEADRQGDERHGHAKAQCHHSRIDSPAIFGDSHHLMFRSTRQAPALDSSRQRLNDREHDHADCGIAQRLAQNRRPR